MSSLAWWIPDILMFTWLYWFLRDPSGLFTWILQGAWTIAGMIAQFVASVLYHDIVAAGMTVCLAWLVYCWWKQRPPRWRKKTGQLLGAKSRALRANVVRRWRDAGGKVPRPVPVPG